MAAPANTSPTTAFPITLPLPVDAFQRVDDAGTTYTVWFSWIAPFTGEVSVWGFGDLVVYTPTTLAFLGPATSPVAYMGGIGGVNKPFQMPVNAGIQYFFKVTPNGGNPTPANLDLSIVGAPAIQPVAGQIFVPDDTEGFPGVRLNFPDGAPQGFELGFPAGEVGDVFAGGAVLVAYNNATQLAIFTPGLVFIRAIFFANPSIVRMNKTLDVAYVGNAGGGAVHATVTTVSSAGNLGPKTWTLPAAGLVCGCTSPTGGILYYSAGGATPAVKQYDLVNELNPGDLAAGVANYAIADMLGLDDGTILVLYIKTIVNRDAFVRRYSVGGVVLNTYTVGVANQTSTSPKLAYALDHPNSFWAWTHDNVPFGFSQFDNVRVSDGAVLNTFTIAEFEGGVSRPAASATPARFGISFSCPFMLLRIRAGVSGPNGLLQPNPPDHPGLNPNAPNTVVHTIRRLRRAPHLSDEQVWNFFHRFQLDIEAGNDREVDLPMIYDLRWSDDGGHTWSNYHAITCDQKGQYTFRAIWRKLGRSRDRVFEVTDSNRGRTVLLDAFLEFTKGTS
jgi:hypothetical protein